MGVRLCRLDGDSPLGYRGDSEPDEAVTPMNEHELTLLRRKAIIGTMAAVAWGLGLLLVLVAPRDGGDIGGILMFAGWLFTATWIILDAIYRGRNVVPWAVFGLAAAPLAALIYVVTAQPSVAVCTHCGSSLATTAQTCPICGAQHMAGRVTSALNQAYTSLADSLMRAPVEQAKNTTRALAIALGVVGFLGTLMTATSNSIPGPLAAVFVLCYASYWVLLPWWVYLDASWRRMEPIPWALLTLLTNIVGLVTYLVIRYPDPRSCPKCGSDLAVGLKRCPYCGSEAEPTCPKCQAPIRPDWVFCPSCATQLPIDSMRQTPGIGVTPSGKPPAISISGSVVDGATGLPLQGAEVKVDSKDETAVSMTDTAGRFLLSELDPRPYVLIASAEGYASQAKAFTPMAVGAGQCHFTLMPSRTQAEAETQGVTSNE